MQKISFYDFSSQRPAEERHSKHEQHCRPSNEPITFLVTSNSCLIPRYTSCTGSDQYPTTRQGECCGHLINIHLGKKKM